MRKFLTAVLFIFATFSVGCSLFSSKGGDEPDAAAPPVKSDPPPAPVFDEAFCKESLQRCINTVKSTIEAFPSLNETRKLCPGLTDRKEIKLPLSDAEYGRIKAMGASTDCATNLKVCREFRNKAGSVLSSGMKELKDCDPPK